MRAPFDTTCDITSGPDWTPANTMYAVNVPCRLVLDDQIVQHFKYIDRQTHYMTLDQLLPTGRTIVHGPPNWTIDAGFGDRVSIPSGTAPAWGILWIETITPTTGTPYHRCHLVALPDPDGEW